MGDRGNIVMRYGSDKAKDVYFYTHWRGCDIPSIVQSVLRLRQRWDDDAYLARMMFCELASGASDKTTGFGISPYLCDNEHNLLIVDTYSQSVIEQKEKGEAVRRWTFDQFTNLEIEKHFKDF